MQRARPLAARSAIAGSGEHSIQLEESNFSDTDELKLKLLSIFRSPHYTPPVLPQVAIDLMEVTRDPNASYGSVLKVLERDPLIVADILKVAQSPLFSGRSGVNSLSDALNRLGMSSLRDVVWQTVAKARLFRVHGYDEVMLRLQAHSLFTAHVSRFIAGHAGLPPDQAFLCGLLHDVGMSGTVIAIAESSGSQEPPPLSLFWAALDKMHMEASGMMARLWGLSPELCVAIGTHHADADRNPIVNPLVATLCLAESLAEEFGWSVMERNPECPVGTGIDQNPPALAVQAAVRLNLLSRLPTIRAQAQRVAELLSDPGA